MQGRRPKARNSSRRSRRCPRRRGCSPTGARGSWSRRRKRTARASNRPVKKAASSRPPRTAKRSRMWRTGRSYPNRTATVPRKRRPLLLRAERWRGVLADLVTPHERAKASKRGAGGAPVLLGGPVAERGARRSARRGRPWKRRRWRRARAKRRCTCATIRRSRRNPASRRHIGEADEPGVSRAGLSAAVTPRRYATPPGKTSFGGRLGFLDATPDLAHVVLDSEVSLLEGAAPGLYEWEPGGAFAAGERAAEGAPAGDREVGDEPQLGDEGANVRGAISDAGSRVFFSSAGSEGPKSTNTPPLYARHAERGNDAAQRRAGRCRTGRGRKRIRLPGRQPRRVQGVLHRHRAADPGIGAATGAPRRTTRPTCTSAKSSKPPANSAAI